MSETKTKNNDELKPYSNELISTDASLRNLYYLGFNQKALSKNMINSFKFEEVVTNIKSYIESDELSLKASGHLLVGLLRVYDKKIKFYLEELKTLFKIKKSDSKEEDNDIKSNQAQVGTKLKNAKNNQNSNKNKDNQPDNSTTVEASSLSSYFNRNNNMLSLSPLNDGLFSMLNENFTPSKMNTTGIQNSENTNSLNTSPKRIEAFRANNQNSSILLESKSKGNFDYGSNIKSNANIIEERSIFEEEQDVNNFFQFISDNVLRHPELPLEMKNEFNNIEIAEPQLDDMDKEFVMNSDTKPLFNFESELKNLKQKNKIKRVLSSFEYDDNDKMHIDIKYATRNESHSETGPNIIEKFKNEWRYDLNFSGRDIFSGNSKENFLSPDVIFENQVYLSENKFESKENKRNAGNQYDDSFFNNFSSLDIKDFNTNGDVTINVHEKLSKIYEEEEKQKAEEKENYNFDDFNIEQQQVNNFNDSFNLAELNLESNQIKTNFSNLNDAIHKVLKKKKGKMSFTNLIETEIIKKEFASYDVFYNLLCMAQREELKMTQDQIFINKDIHVTIQN